MTSIKLKFRAHKDKDREGALYIRVVHDNVVRQLKTGYRIYACEWNRRKGDLVEISPVSEVRSGRLKLIRCELAREIRKMEQAVRNLQHGELPYSTDDVIHRYKKEAASDRITVFEYMKRQAERLKNIGRIRTSETYRQALHSFMKYRGDVDLYFEMFDADTVERYESHMRANRLSRNTTSFYLRILRCVYNRAVEEGLAVRADLFKRVYTGVDKTAKRAVTLKEIRRIKELDLTDRPDLDYARHIFLFSFYMRGMSFIDMAYLRKKDLSNGYVSYIRKKTGRQLTIRWEKPMQEIVDQCGESPTQYLLPIITRQDGTERRQYLNKILYVNRKLKQIARMAKITIPLSMYVSRHSWASIAMSKNIPLSVISEGMGHDNEETTRIYLSAIQTDRIDEANNRILNEL